MKNRKSCFTIPILLYLTAGGSTMAFADVVPFGLTFFVQGNATTIIAPGTGPLGGVYVQNLQRLTYSDNFALTAAFSTSTFSGSIDNAQLHAFSATSVSSNTGSATGSNASNGADEYWFDTFNFLPGSYNVTLALHGTLTNNEPVSGVGDLVDSLSFLENGTVIPGELYSGIVATLYGQNETTQDVAIPLTFSSPASMVLGELLQTRNALFLASVISRLTIPIQATLRSRH